MPDPIAPGFMRVVCLDGPRKGREYYFKLDTTDFGITSLVPGSVQAVYYHGAAVSGYGQYIYRVVSVWGMSPWTRNYGAVFERLAHKGQ